MMEGNAVTGDYARHGGSTGILEFDLGSNDYHSRAVGLLSRSLCDEVGWSFMCTSVMYSLDALLGYALEQIIVIGFVLLDQQTGL